MKGKKLGFRADLEVERSRGSGIRSDLDLLLAKPMDREDLSHAKMKSIVRNAL